jgi:ABC-type phosphate transport system substrate-binding protein
MRRTKLVALLLLLGVGGASTAVVAEEHPAYRVVVHPSNSASSVDRKFLSDAFLKKATRWSGGEVIRPVDLDAESPVRRRFSQEVLGRSVSAVKSYWQQVIFSGRDVPPPELDTDEQVIRYVVKSPGAVGYVSGSAAVSGVKILTVK